MNGPEPRTTIEEYFSAEWLEWLRSHTDEELNVQADVWGRWVPNNKRETDRSDLVMMKWECACDELDRRKRERQGQ